MTATEQMAAWIVEFRAATQANEDDLFTSMGGGRRHAHVEAWGILGRIVGVSARIVDIRPEYDDSGQIVRCTVMAEAIDHEGRVLTMGAGIADAGETSRGGRRVPWAGAAYSVVGMASTRAIGRTYCNCLRDLMKLAGYSGTPLEEMPETTQQEARGGVEKPAPVSEPAQAGATPPAPETGADATGDIHGQGTHPATEPKPGFYVPELVAKGHEDRIGTGNPAALLEVERDLRRRFAEIGADILNRVTEIIGKPMPPTEFGAVLRRGAVADGGLTATALRLLLALSVTQQTWDDGGRERATGYWVDQMQEEATA